MDRNNGSNRYTPIRRAGQQPHQSANSLSSSSSTLSSSSNNNEQQQRQQHHQQQQQHLDNHRNNSLQYSTSSVYASPQSTMSREPLTQHDELIRYIKEAWTKVSEQGTPVNYCNESDHQLKNFKPFNLEEYWDQRHFQNIHVSHGQQ